MLIRTKSVSDLIIKAWPSLAKKAQVKAKTKDKTKNAVTTTRALAMAEQSKVEKKFLLLWLCKSLRKTFLMLPLLLMRARLTIVLLHFESRIRLIKNR